MNTYTPHSTPTVFRINSASTLALCDACHEHPPLVIFTGPEPRGLCPLCAVRTQPDELTPEQADQLGAALLAWITTPMPHLDCADGEFYARMDTGRSWTARQFAMESERIARKEWVRACCGDVAA